MAERISVKRASELTGLSPLTIRMAMKNHELDIGTALSAGKNRTNYHIVPEKLAAYLGIPVEMVKEK